jgi:glycolate oxidase FAD binding subunit
VVKSVSGYDVPKLMVGSLGTLGVIVEGTLRLHPLPEASASWLLSADSPEVITDCLAALLDTALEPDRVVALNRAAAPGLEAAGRGPMLLVSFGSVAEAVASQGAALERLAAGHRARAGMAPEGVWSSLAHGHDGALRMRLACEPARLMAWLAQVERLASGLGLEAACLGQGGQGVLEVALRGAMPPADLGPGLVLPLREGLAPEGGSLVLEAAPAHLKAGLDAWGAISPEVQELFSRLKREFDPLGILNPGRFVGGL